MSSPNKTGTLTESDIPCCPTLLPQLVLILSNDLVLDALIVIFFFYFTLDFLNNSKLEVILLALLSYILQYSAEFLSLNWIFFQEFSSEQICLQNLRIFLNYALLFIIKIDYPRLHVLIFFLFSFV